MKASEEGAPVMNPVPARKSFQEESDRIRRELKVKRTMCDVDMENFIQDAAFQAVQAQQEEAFERGVLLGLVSPYPFEDTAADTLPPGAVLEEWEREHLLNEIGSAQSQQDDFLNTPGMWEKVWSTPLPTDLLDGPPEEWGPDHPDFEVGFDVAAPKLALGRPRMR